MNFQYWISRASRLALPILTVLALVALTGCYYQGDGYYGGPHGDYGVSGGVYGGGDPHHRHPYKKKLKPKEKAHLGYGPHAGHPHGGPPGQLKKRGYYY